MENVIGSICIIGSGIFMLWQRKKENQRRSETLTDMIYALRNMADGVRLTRIPLPDLLEQIAQGSGKDTASFLRRISLAMRAGNDAANAWKCSCEALPIQKSEQAAVSAIAGCLRNDEESICKGIELSNCLLRQHKESWDKQRVEEERRTAALYILGALLLVILLI